MKAKLLRVLSIAILLASMLLMLVPFEALAQEIVDDSASSSQPVPLYRRSFHADGRYWEFYVASGNLYYKSSLDGISWSGRNIFAAMNYGYALYFEEVSEDEGYVHLTYVSGVYTTYLNYRRGVPNGTTGIITFNTNYVIASCPTNYTSRTSPTITLDGNGYPYVSYIYYEFHYMCSGTCNYHYHYFHVTKSSTKDGVWATEWDTRVTSHSNNNGGIVIGLTGGKVVALHQPDGATVIYAKRWTGSGWGSEVNSASAVAANGYSVVGQDDNVHIAALKGTANDIFYTKYSYSTNSFSAETTIYGNATSTSIPSMSMDNANNLHVFWENDPTDDHMYYAKYIYDMSTWVSYYDLINEIDLLPATGYYLNTDYTCDESRVGVYYIADTTILKFKLLSEVFVVDTLSASAITPTTATMRGEIMSLGFGSATHRGFYINTTPSLVGATQHDETPGPYNVGVFTHGVTGLLNGLDYSYIAYAQNTWGTVYGLWVQFTAGGSGSGFVVETLTPTNIGSGGATFNANVLNVGPGITWHGFEHGKTVATMVQWTEASGNITGAYSHPVTGLAEDTLYYVRAMIGNGTATSYGEYVGFFTIWTSLEPPAKAYMDITVTGNCTSDYDYVSLFTTDVVHTALINAGYINGNATDTQLTVFMNGAIPYLPVSDRLAFMLTDFANNEERTLRYYLGTTALQDDFLITVGFNGNMTTADKDALEPGNTWQIDVSGYLDMSSGNASNWNKYIFYKQDALSLYIGGLGNLTATIGNDTAPTKSISIAGIDSGSHILQVDSNAVDFRLYVDGTLMASTPTSSVGNNTNPWYFMGNNSLVAMDYFKLAVATIEKLWYQPTAYVSGTNVVDRDGTGNGTINWGTNPSCITIRVGSILSNSIPPEGGGDGTMWTAPDIDVSGWFGGCASVASQPFYASFLSAATDMGMPVCSLYLMVMLGCAAAIGLGTLVFTGSIMISVISTSVAMLAAANTTVVPVYLLFVFALMAVSIVYLSRQT